MLKTVAMGVQSALTEGFAMIVDGLGYLAKALDFVGGKFGKDFGLASYTDAIANDLHDLADTQMGETTKALDDMWNTEPVDNFFANARKKMDDVRAKANATQLDLKKVGAPGTIVPEKKPEMHFAKAMQAGTSEAASTLLRSRYGGGKSNKELEQIAKSGQEANKHLSKIADAVTKNGDSGEVWEDFG